MSVNKTIILGFLGQDPELRFTTGGAPVCTLSVATSESWSNKQTGLKQEKTEWHRVVIFGKLAELCNTYLSKGRQVYLEGKLETRSWDDKDGNKRYTTQINASTVQFIGQSKQEESTNNQPAYSKNSNEESSFCSDDIPF